MKNEHTIIPLKTKGLFKVINNLDGSVYKVDIFKPFCSGPNFKYSGKTKTGRKRICKHIKICRGVE